MQHGVFRHRTGIRQRHRRIVRTGDRNADAAGCGGGAIAGGIGEHVISGRPQIECLNGGRRVGELILIGAVGAQCQRAVGAGVSARCRHVQGVAHIVIAVVDQHVAGCGWHAIFRHRTGIVHRHRRIIGVNEVESEKTFRAGARLIGGNHLECYDTDLIVAAQTAEAAAGRIEPNPGRQRSAVGQGGAVTQLITRIIVREGVHRHGEAERRVFECVVIGQRQHLHWRIVHIGDGDGKRLRRTCATGVYRMQLHRDAANIAVARRT